MNRESISGSSYTGRFAPSPSGHLHFGSLVAALGSYLDAKAAGGRWLLRMEDLDTPRNVPGAAEDILSTLEGYGFQWDGEVTWQSRRQSLYREALERLKGAGLVFPCGCTRREIADSRTGHVPGSEVRYPGTCRHGLAPGRQPRSWRFQVPEGEVFFPDRVQGRIVQDVAAAVGDFVLQRADGLFAYQLAVVVDDAEQGVNRVVRGADLLDSTPRQIALQRALGLPAPDYAHLPVAANATGEKLSKQTKARALAGLRPQAVLATALEFLGQEPPAGLEEASLDEFWTWAVPHWDISRVPGRHSLSAPEGFG
ncbi:MAG: tRNA glutamyl-Q(34) synthetase GluQRS [Rhodocyclaceae bacterium]|nr:tRNA glutamyl-Q(34) synthetase GluQRS [Rhodocyclaceae bacterium]